MVLVDPYISRPNLNELEDSDLVVSGTSMIEKVIGKENFILVTHSHMDHLLEVVFIAKKSDFDFFSTYDFEFLAGRSFNNEINTD